MTTPRVRCSLCRRLVQVWTDGRFPDHGPPVLRCRGSRRDPEEVRAQARREATRSKRKDWSRMHARGSNTAGWRFKEKFPSYSQARDAAAAANADPATTARLTPYRCNWGDAPPPNAAKGLTWHYHIGRAAIDEPTQRG